MEKKTIIILAAAVLVGLIVLRSRRRSEPQTVDEFESDENAQKSVEEVQTVVDDGFLEDAADADRELIAAGEDTLWNNFAAMSQTR